MYKCGSIACDEEVIGESATTFGESLRKHLRASCPIYDHTDPTGHLTNVDIFSNLGRGSCNFARTINEAISLKINNPSLSWNIVKYQLSCIAFIQYPRPQT